MIIVCNTETLPFSFIQISFSNHIHSYHIQCVIAPKLFGNTDPGTSVDLEVTAEFTLSSYRLVISYNINMCRCF